MDYDSKKKKKNHGLCVFWLFYGLRKRKKKKGKRKTVSRKSDFKNDVVV